MDCTKFDFELAHLGINQENAEEAKQTVALLATLFGFSARETDGSYFVNEQFEVMKKPFLGRLGHVGIRTNDAQAARLYLENKGIEMNEESAGYAPDGSLNVIYFKNDIAGFAFHLTQKR